MYVNTLITLQENASTYGTEGKRVVGHVTFSSPGRVMCYVQNLKEQLSGVYALYVFAKQKNKGVRIGQLKHDKETKWLVNEKNIEGSGIRLDELDGVAIVAEQLTRGTEVVLSGFRSGRYMIIPIIDELFSKNQPKATVVEKRRENLPKAVVTKEIQPDPLPQVSGTHPLKVAAQPQYGGTNTGNNVNNPNNNPSNNQMNNPNNNPSNNQVNNPNGSQSVNAANNQTYNQGGLVYGETGPYVGTPGEAAYENQEQGMIQEVGSVVEVSQPQPIGSGQNFDSQEGEGLAVSNQDMTNQVSDNNMGQASQGTSAQPSPNQLGTPANETLEDGNPNLIKIAEQLPNKENSPDVTHKKGSGIPNASVAREEDTLDQIINQIKEDEQINEKTRSIEQQIEQMSNIPQMHKQKVEETSEQEVTIESCDPKKALEYLAALKKDISETTENQGEIDYLQEINNKIKEIEEKRMK